MNAIDLEKYVMKLYVAGSEQNSMLAKQNLGRFCDEYLKDRCQVEVIDVLVDFAAAQRDRIYVTPTLVLVTPEPHATMVGNLSDKKRVISTLHVRIEQDGD